MPNHATAEGVAVAWCSTLAVPAVATTLPELSTWPIFAGTTVRGFVIVDGVVGSRIMGNGMRVPVISFSSWAAVQNSDRPQWGAANEMIERIWAQTQRHGFPSVRVQQGASYREAYVHSVYGVSEPRRVPDPDTSRAHYVSEIAMMWTEA